MSNYFNIVFVKMDKKRIYAPNLNKVFEAFDNHVQKSVLVDEGGDDYLASLLTMGVLVKVESKYEVGQGWQFMMQSGFRRASQFKQKLLGLDEVVKISNCIGEEGRAVDRIIEELNTVCPPETVRTYISWLETLGILQLKDGKYNNSNEEEEETEAADYPSLEDNISIKEDKYSIYEYLRRLDKGNIILSPDFQRHEVWKPEQKSKFIESVLMGLPLPPIYLKKDADTKYIVVDGLQRTSTLRDFANGMLVLNGLDPAEKNMLNGVTYNTLDNVREGLQARFEDRQMQFFIMEPTVPMSVVYDVFNRINTGGTQLSRQEIRNCVFQGNSTRIIKAIAEDDVFKQAIDYGIQELRMKDREAVMRCLAFVVLNYELDYDGSMDKFLEKAMIRINKMSQPEVDDIKKKALDTYSLTWSVFEKANFRIPTDCTRGRINIAVMETVFHCFYNQKRESNNIEQLRDAFWELLSDENYLNAVRWSTGSTNQVKTRFRKAHNAFDTLLSI